MKAAIYARVSTIDKDQNPEVQLSKLREYCQLMEWEIYQEYVDKASAADLVKREAWKRLMKEASTRRFNLLLVWKLDRAFRSVIHASNTLNMLRGYGVGFRSYMEPAMDTTTAIGEFIFNISAAFAELERQTISQRVLAGIAFAKQHGTKSGNSIGRKPFNIPLTNICKALRDSDGCYSAAARLLEREFKKSVSPGFVQIRIQRGGLTYEEVMAGKIS